MKRVSFSSKLIRAVQASLAGVCLLAVGDASARALLERIDELDLESTGIFRHMNGETLPW